MKHLPLFILLSLISIWGCYAYLDVSLSTATTTFPRGSPIKISVHFSNLKSEGSVFLLKWGTPYETDAEFQVLFNNITVPYDGVTLYRIPTPTTNDFIEIKAGEIKTIQSDLWKNFDFTRIGTYHIRLDYFIRGYFMTPNGDKIEFGPLSGLSNELMIDVIENPNAPLDHPFRPSAFHTQANYQCSSSQLNTINSAWSTARGAINTAANFASGSSNYIKWFGSVTSAREQRVRTVFSKLKSTSSLRYSCGGPSCSSNTYGYVYPTDTSKTVYLCALFWTSTTEAIRTLIHEATHFNDIGGTKDYAYGTSECMNLARSSPDKAIYNADNFCYFTY